MELLADGLQMHSQDCDEETRFVVANFLDRNDGKRSLTDPV